MKNLKKIIKAVSDKLNLDKKGLAVLAAGIIGIILLVLSELIPKNFEKSAKEAENSITVSSSEYEKDIEGRLQNLISQIDGAGSVSVMVTLENTVESVYAQQEKESGGDIKSSENEYVIIKTDDGEGGILLTTTQPQIRGVAVVCSGGNSAVVRQNITNTVTAVLGISSARVNITAMKTDNGG